jgi:hypothetical protein
MATEHIVALLIAERDKLNRAIEALGGAPTLPRRGRPKATAPAPAKSAGMSAARRKEQSERMKAYWAKKRKSKSAK